MIFTAIVDSKKLKNYYEKRDCLNWQPLTLISKDTLALIENTKNEKSLLERFAAYSLLYYSARKIYDYKINSIKKTEIGKPYIDDELLNGKLFISISHSGSISAVTISDEGECGVDVQLLTDAKILENAEKRFLSSFDLSNSTFRSFDNSSDVFLSDDVGANSYSASKLRKSYLLIAEPCEFGFSFSPLNFISGKNDSLMKWTVSEALLKCSGGGFRDLEIINQINQQCDVRYCSFKLNNYTYGLAVSIKI